MIGFGDFAVTILLKKVFKKYSAAKIILYTGRTS
jgi:hypothetical protein